MWLQEIVQFQQGESLRHWELGLGPFLSITRLEMKNPAVVCSDCKTTEKMLTSQIHHHPVFFFSVLLDGGGNWCLGGEVVSVAFSAPPAALALGRAVMFTRRLGRLKENQGISKRFQRRTWKNAFATRFPD